MANSTSPGQTNLKLVAERTVQHPGFTCTAYLMACGRGILSIHTISRGEITYSVSSPKRTTYPTALADLDYLAHQAPLT